MAEHILELDEIKKSFGKTQVLKGISLSVRQGEFITFLGASGCGKTTTLRIIAGLEVPDEGKVFLNGKDVTALEPNQRNVNTVFQNYALFPHMNVFANIAYGLKLKRMPKKEIARKVEEMLELVQLSGYERRMPSELSGGQKQRVAIARALATSPKLLLCDEPTSALDSLTTRSILELLSDINHRLGVTIIIITHEIAVVRKICNKVAVLEGGVLVDNGPIGEVLDSDMHPITRSLFFGRED